MSETQQNPSQEPPRENEIADYYDGVKQQEIQAHESGIKKARTALFVTAALVLVGELISISAAGVGFPPLVIAVIAVEVGIFVALAFWTKTKPYSAIIIGIIVFILMWILAIMVNGGKGIYSGVVVKIIILVILFKALKDAKAWQELKKTI